MNQGLNYRNMINMKHSGNSSHLYLPTTSTLCENESGYSPVSQPRRLKKIIMKNQQIYVNEQYEEVDAPHDDEER